MEKCCQIAGLYLATLRSIYLIHQQNHWLTKGKNFYGDHLLFQRLYESAQTSADLAAEKFVGLLGEDALDFDFQAKLMNNVINRYSALSGKPLEMSMAVEKDFLRLCQESYTKLDEEGVMSLGLDDALSAIASKSEEAIYLLSQALK